MNTVLVTNAGLANKPNRKPVVYTVIATHEEKQEFTAKTKGKRAISIIIKMSELNTSQILWRFEDINEATQLSPIVDSENETISYEVVLKPVKSIKKINNFYEFTVRSKGKIYITEEELGEFKDMIISEPVDVKVKCSQKTIQAFVYKNCIYRQPTYTPISLIQNHNPYLNIQLRELSNHMAVDPDKLTVLSSVFSHCQIVKGSEYTLAAFYKAVIIGYLTHLSRESTPSNILASLIHQLKSRHVVVAKLKSEERFKILIEHLECLQLNRSLNHLQSLLNKSKFLKTLVREFKEIIKLNPQSKEFVKERNKHKKVVALCKILSKELNILIVLHSPHTVKSFNIWEDKFEVIINLVFNSRIWSQVCLLYYEYHHAEDNNITIDTERFKCLDCKKLPHQVYFTSPDLRRCQRCIFRDEKRRKKANIKLEDSKSEGKYKLVENIKQAEAIKHQEDRKLEEEKEVMTYGNRCEGCNGEYPENETCNHSVCGHLLCYRCLIASDEQNRCEACKQRMGNKAQIRANSRANSNNMIVNPTPTRKNDTSFNKEHNSSQQVDGIRIEDTIKPEQSSDIRDLNQSRKPNENSKKQVPDAQHQIPTNFKRRNRGKKLAKSKDNSTQ
jgi:hypothetical protein